MLCTSHEHVHFVIMTELNTSVFILFGGDELRQTCDVNKYCLVWIQVPNKVLTFLVHKTTERSN